MEIVFALMFPFPISCTVPDGVRPPLVYSLNDTSVRVSCIAPLRPNGQVTGYFIYVNGLKVDPLLRSPGSYVVTNLHPYTVYDVQVILLFSSFLYIDFSLEVVHN